MISTIYNHSPEHIKFVEEYERTHTPKFNIGDIVYDKYDKFIGIIDHIIVSNYPVYPTDSNYRYCTKDCELSSNSTVKVTDISQECIDYLKSLKYYENTMDKLDVIIDNDKCIVKFKE